MARDLGWIEVLLRCRLVNFRAYRSSHLNPDELGDPYGAGSDKHDHAGIAHLANSANDPDFSKAGALFASLRSAISDRHRRFLRPAS